MSGCKDMKKNKQEETKRIVNKIAGGNPLSLDKTIELSDKLYYNKKGYDKIVNALYQENEYDEYTCSHSLDVAFYSTLIGGWMGLDEKSIQEVLVAGLLHDIGKVKVPLKILNKEKKLTKAEFNEIKKHSNYGFDIINHMNCFSKETLQAVLHHHEHMDGSGYPEGLVGNQINTLSKIIAVADVYDALTSDRVYRERITPFKAFDILKNMESKNLDQEIVTIFIENISRCFNGSKVLLNTGEIGKVVESTVHNLTEPVVLIDNNYFDLSMDKDRSIISML